MSRWFLRNLSSLGLALILAVMVWIVAVHEEDPIEERPFPSAVTVEMSNTESGTILVGNVPRQAAVTLRAPRSIWDTLTESKIHVLADLSGLGPGEHDVPLTWRIDDPVARVIALEPAVIHVTLESQTRRDLTVRATTTGEPALGYEAGVVRMAVSTAVVAGPASAVDSVSEVRAPVLLTGLKGDFDEDVRLVPVDSNGVRVAEVSVEPATAHVLVPITHKLGFRDVAVKVVVQGQVAAGYRVTNITVAPPVVTVSSADPAKVAELPGYVETQPISIANASDDLTLSVALDLPNGVSLVSEQSVVVQVNIAAIESSLTVERKLEIQGLGAGLTAAASPDNVDVILSGPLPVLDSLKPNDVRVFLNLQGLGPGTYQITPQVILLPDKLSAESVLPSQIEVTITSTATPTRKP